MSCLIDNDTYNAYNTLPAFGVTGTDGIVPNYNPNGLFHIWAMNEVYIGQQGSNKYVPKLNDYVVEPGTFTWYIVDHVDPVTLIPTLRQLHPADNNSNNISNTLFGGLEDCCETFRLFIDKSVTPSVCCIDIRFGLPGTMASYAKVFLGPAPGRVISKMYDSSGLFISENIPLQSVMVDNHTNYTYKTVMPFYCTDDLIDGEYVTVVVYSDVGIAMYKKGLVVLNSAYIRDINMSQKYISHISLESPFLSSVDNHLLEFPLNVPTNAMDLWGIVNYSDGSSLRLPVDSGKFKMLGIDQYLSSIVGQQIDLVLRYELGPNETAYAGGNNSGYMYVTEPYKLITVNPNNSFTVKLFVYPELNTNPLNGYNLKWYLFNLDRNIWYDVTGLVQFSVNTGTYDPTAYGFLQRKQVSINLRSVSASFRAYIHTQIVEIQLMGTPNNAATPWMVSHESVAGRPLYGTGLKATYSGNTVSISSGITDYNEWYEKVYLNTFPLVNPIGEINPVIPTHFVLRYNGTVTEVSMSNWNNMINIGTPLTLYSSIEILFIKKTTSGDLYLSMASMVVSNV